MISPSFQQRNLTGADTLAVILPTVTYISNLAPASPMVSDPDTG